MTKVHADILSSFVGAVDLCYSEVEVCVFWAVEVGGKFVYLGFYLCAVVAIGHAEHEKPAWILSSLFVVKDSVNPHDRTLRVNNFEEKELCG